jgi:branched-chain amino acid transport system permease protein
MTAADRTLRSLLAAGAALALLWFLPLLSPSEYFVSLAARLLAMVLLVGSFNLLMSYLGLTSFGHSALFGVGAYALGLVLQGFDPDIGIALFASLLAGAFVAAATGPIMLRSAGIYFLLLSLAIGQVLWGIAESWRAVTAGSDGMIIAATAHFAGIKLDDPERLFRLVAIVVVLGVWVLRGIVRSPFGLVLRGVRDSEMRMAALGFDVFRLRLIAFSVSGAFAGLAGGLVATVNHFVSPDLMSVRLAVELVLAVILGGRGSFWGPLVAALGLFGVEEAISIYSAIWPLFLGLIFIASVYVLRFELVSTAWFVLWRLVSARSVLAREDEGKP